MHNYCIDLNINSAFALFHIDMSLENLLQISSRVSLLNSALSCNCFEFKSIIMFCQISLVDMLHILLFSFIGSFRVPGVKERKFVGRELFRN